MALSTEDIAQIRSKGINPEETLLQIENFRKGFPFVDLVKPAIIDHGIVQLGENEARLAAEHYQNHLNEFSILKFVPASGAASRMFKNLFNFLEENNGTPEYISKIEEDNDFNSVGYFLKHIDKFAFRKELNDVLLRDGFQLDNLLEEKQYHTIIDYLLNEKGLNYGSLPKGLLLFHRYPDHPRTSIEEHLVEAATYANGNVHFTLSPEHISPFLSLIEQIKPGLENRFGIQYNISHSIQKQSTDTIAVDMTNEPFRDSNGQLVFRPGGHGALISNLGELDADIVFIKNIDNIVPDRLKDTTYLYKQAIGGMLMRLKQQLDKLLNELDKEDVSYQIITETEEFAVQELMIDLPDEYQPMNPHQKKHWLFQRLNRPLRICGMVKNQGEPGGGPFWLKNQHGEISLQIVESSQVNLQDENQLRIFRESTHFNPVDLVCSLKDYKGNAFDLKKFVDPSTGFISIKSKDGRNLKAQELPGLWNGAMANWISIFIETPLITFNPVKVINDLLRPEHQ